MKSDYSRDIFKQLEETMKRLDKMESTLENTKLEHKIEIDHLNDKIDSLEKENAALKIENTKLKDDNERLRRIINNDSTNSSLPPSSDEKPAKAANEFNHRNNKGYQLPLPPYTPVRFGCSKRGKNQYPQDIFQSEGTAGFSHLSMFSLLLLFSLVYCLIQAATLTF